PAAVTLQGGGTYFGRDNNFHDNEIGIWALNPDGIFTWLKETSSLFYENMSTPMELNDVSEIFLIDNEITVDFTGEYPTPIFVRGGSGATIIQGNLIHSSDAIARGINVFNRHGAEVTGNFVDGIYEYNSQFHAYGILLTMIGNLSVETNQVYDNTDATGIMISGCPGATVSTNYLNENTRNLDVLNSDGIALESNICSYGSDADIMMTNSQIATLCNNNCYYGTDGIKLSSTNMMLEMNDNTMTHCDRGLVYMQNVLTNAQVEKGNTFVLNTLGAEFEDVTDPGVISSMRYVVLNTSTEYPSHSPSDWFVNTGTTSLDCTPMGPIPPVDIKADIDRLTKGTTETSPDGKCTNDIMIALRMIEAQPDFLGDKDIEDFYETYHNTTIDKLPTIEEIFSSCMSLFPISTPVLEIEEDGTLDNLVDQKDDMEDLDEDYQNLVSGQLDAIDDMIDNVSELEPENEYEESYQFAILQLLGLLKGDTLTTANESDIIDLAEGCITEDGPGVYVAQLISSAVGLSYTRATSCTPVIPRSEKKESIKMDRSDISIIPNPVTNYIELSGPVPGQTVYICDMLGKLIFTHEQWTGRRLNLPDLKPGIYILQLEKTVHPLRFIKA
ncbi:MAG: right-handed parallel beta-helix repeat-containing protein, partial [Saprospiraceae bacterium]